MVLHVGQFVDGGSSSVHFGTDVKMLADVSCCLNVDAAQNK